MKRILLLSFIGCLSLTLTALGAHKGKSAQRSSPKHGARSAHVSSPRGESHHVSQRSARARASHHSVARAAHSSRRSHVTAAPVRRNSHSTRHLVASRHGSNNHRATVRRDTRGHGEKTKARMVNSGRNANRLHNERGKRATTVKTDRARAERSLEVDNRDRNSARPRIERELNARKAGRTQSLQTNVTNAARRHLAANPGRSITLGRNQIVNYNGENVRIVNDWHQPRFRGNSNYSAFYNYNNNCEWHDRWWWNNHYSRVVFVLGGWWYWNSGYWYPAWGYDPYASYAYAGPIYTGSAELTPHEIVANVQVALQDWGYDPGAIDGVLGPNTRAAIAAFQTDQGLLVTSSIDRPTLQTLGLS